MQQVDPALLTDIAERRTPEDGEKQSKGKQRKMLGLIEKSGVRGRLKVENIARSVGTWIDMCLDTCVDIYAYIHMCRHVWRLVYRHGYRHKYQSVLYKLRCEETCPGHLTRAALPCSSIKCLRLTLQTLHNSLCGSHKSW